MLIHAGASGVGTAAIQLVRLAKAIPIATAGTQEKLKATANAGAAAGFNYKTEDFCERSWHSPKVRTCERPCDSRGGAHVS